MGQVSSKFRSAEWDGKRQLCFYCPGCKETHGVRVAGPNSWGWNGDLDAPTFTPSIAARGMIFCHSFVENGQIRFLSDSEHALAGQTVPMPDLPDFLRDT